jgi:hypothetical protein
LSSGVAFGLIVSVLFSGPSGAINNVGIALFVIIVELGKEPCPMVYFVHGGK